MLNPISKLKNKSIIESLKADLTDTRLEAITLFFFIGCFRSLFLSMQSLIKYIEDETRQNAKNAFRELIQIWDSKENTKSGAKKTIKFFCQWFGLIAISKFLNLILLILIVISILIIIRLLRNN